MNTSKIKNIIIIVLLLLNIILLSVFLFDRYESANARKAEIAALTEVMEQNNITLADELDFDCYAPPACTVYRSEQNDAKLIDNLIGSFYQEDMGGNVFFYSSEKGQAILRGTGEASLIFNEDMPEMGNDRRLSISKFMSQNGIEVYPELAEENGDTLVFPCVIADKCVYNSRLSFNISGDKLMMIDGFRVFDGEIEERDEQLIDSVSAIMCFLDMVRTEGYICSAVTGLDSGYFMNVAVSGVCTLRPVWRVSTDIGDVYINAVTGKAESLPTPW